MNIYLKKFKDKDPESIHELLVALFSYAESQDRLTSCTTYKDKACTTVQTPCNRFRSFDEVEMIVQTYFPEVTDPSVVMKELLGLNLYNGGTKLYFSMGLCSTINRIRILYYIHKTPLINKDKYLSKYSWVDLMERLNLKNIDEIYALSEELRNNNEKVEYFKTEEVENMAH